MKTAGVRSSIARFTDEILPAIAPRASHLIVETWVSRGACGETEKQVTKDVARTTERPAETENEIVRLLRRAKELGVAPHVLDVDCHEYQTLIARGGGVDYDRLLAMTGQHLGRAIQQALALPRPADRPLVLVYGGALHNDLAPEPGARQVQLRPGDRRAHARRLPRGRSLRPRVGRHLPRAARRALVPGLAEDARDARDQR